MPVNPIDIIVPPKQQKERLDKYLSEKLSPISRSRIQNLITEGKITIDGSTIKANHIIKPNEVIRVDIPPPRKMDLMPQNIPLKIVYEDAHLLVINKDAGIVMHPAMGNYDNTIVNALLYHCKTLSGINGILRPGIVHRLDKDTSGLVVVAKDDQTHRGLAVQFADRTITREYFALVWGRLKEKSGRIETHLSRSQRDRKKISIHSTGKLAITNYSVLEEYPACSAIRIQLETGRTHQIRVHLAHLGHPVVGDPSYGGRQKFLMQMNQQNRQYGIQMLKKIDRQALHARTLGFTHPVRQRKMFFQSDLPADISLLIEFIKKQALNRLTD
ncbi:RluA family pseudouridine synthase [candidate division KSB1 bacterium]|nr:RluA family pseudouridine synthase [candidate division KSB1 bacterium]